jgi:hypothetical protein
MAGSKLQGLKTAEKLATKERRERKKRLLTTKGTN